MRGIHKAFGSVKVLHGVDFDVLPGEVHVLAGENGAGKSSLIRVLAGVYSDFTGELWVGGRRRRFADPEEAVQAGVVTIHQELSLIGSMSVADNLFLGREVIRPIGQVDFAFQESEAARILEEAGLEVSPRQLVGELPISRQQMVEIARALSRDASVIILDEPTSTLNEPEVDRFFERIVELRRRGCGIVYITHRIEEIYRLADRITVLRDGKLVGTAAPRDLPPRELVAWMVGRDHRTRSAPPPPPSNDPALVVESLRVGHPVSKRRSVVDGMSFTLRRGEILGLVGLQGSGTSEVLHGVFGALGRRAAGRVELWGEPFPMRSPRDSLERGVVLLTSDRKATGLAPDSTVTESVSLASLARFSGFGGWIQRDRERAAVEHLTGQFRLTAPSLDAPVRTLSGGNQQKVYLARCLLARPRVLLLEEPTRGIDVGARADIYDLIRDWVAQGIAILVVTSDMDELLELSDRILVLHRGRIAAELTRGTASKDAILAAAMGITMGEQA
jgi:ABC-type sugar transport system ATPase subunit